MVHKLTPKEFYLKKRTAEYKYMIAKIDSMLVDIDKMHEKVLAGSAYTAKAKEQLLKARAFYEKSIETGNM